ncbi:MAG: 23S rRNA (adenine(2030)-N(6))-methyltransferase RlmJ, partial [Comamonas sp.]
VLIATVQYLTQKEAALTVLDTHGGAGLYRLDGDYASKSGEAEEGVLRLAAAKEAELAPVLQDYLQMVRRFNQGNAIRNYPGSPFISQALLRGHDRLKAFELHPTDMRSLTGNMAQLEVRRQVAILHEDGFEGVKKFLPPPSRRALLLCDPSYELKTDYGRVLDMVADSLKRFPTGTYAVWYPIIPRPDAHDLPKRLKTMTTKAGKSWLHATLTVKSNKTSERGGLPASGMFLINPPFNLKDQLKPAMPQLVKLLGQDSNAGFTLESGG